MRKVLYFYTSCATSLFTKIAAKLIMFIFLMTNVILFLGFFIIILSKLGIDIPRIISCYICKDLYLGTLFIIGICMVILGLIGTNQNMTIKKKIQLLKKFEVILPFMLCMFIFIFIINVLLFLCGINVSINTTNLALFCYTIFCRVVLIKLVVALVISAYTRKFKLAHFSLSVPSVVIIFTLGGFNCYYLIPFINFTLELSLTNATYMFNKTNLLISNTSSKIFDSYTFKYLASYVKNLNMNNIFKYIKGIDKVLIDILFEPVHCSGPNIDFSSLDSALSRLNKNMDSIKASSESMTYKIVNINDIDVKFKYLDNHKYGKYKKNYEDMLNIFKDGARNDPNLPFVLEKIQNIHNTITPIPEESILTTDPLKY